MNEARGKVFFAALFLLINQTNAMHRINRKETKLPQLEKKFTIIQSLGRYITDPYCGAPTLPAIRDYYTPPLTKIFTLLSPSGLQKIMDRPCVDKDDRYLWQSFFLATGQLYTNSPLMQDNNTSDDELMATFFSSLVARFALDLANNSAIKDMNVKLIKQFIDQKEWIRLFLVEELINYLDADDYCALASGCLSTNIQELD